MSKVTFFIHYNIINYIRYNSIRQTVMKNKEIAYKACGLKGLKLWHHICKSIYSIKGTVEDYFLFNFFDKTDEEIKQYTTYGRYIDFFKQLGSDRYAELFSDKALFYKNYKHMLNREIIDLRHANFDEFNNFCKNNKTMVVKPAHGSSGYKISKICVDDYPSTKVLMDELINNKCYICEQLIIQHKDMAKFHDKSINTLRVITTNINGKYSIWGVYIRIGKGDGIADNLGSGGLTATVDINTGKIITPAVTKVYGEKYEKHPISGVKILGFKIPHFDMVKEKCIQYAKEIPDVPFIGWDIAITPDGICVVEANATPLYDITQLSLNKGNFPYHQNILQSLGKAI